MKTFSRICIKDYEVTAENGDHFEIKRGKEYLTSEEKDGTVCVFTKFWVYVPVDLFAGELQFTGDRLNVAKTT